MNDQLRTGIPLQQDESSQKTMPKDQVLEWSASEFVMYKKSAAWYLILTLIAVGGGGLTLLLTRDKFSTIMVVLGLVLFGVFAARPARTLKYKLNYEGIEVGGQFFPYDAFRSFSVMNEGALTAVELSPLKKLAPNMDIYFPPDMADQILEIMALYLPIEQRQRDLVDRFMQRIRF